ncbi:hypothetical protein NDU88_002089 [Pleurodeles waltl]|uniref:Uncharacterized protein n=1 Tax=Pleurodeles waltl TaxID=8319 RepID=A0AAV7KUK1_PLEWA|nr:hypothetical protein NDU88_002089 [Pleurodeles waltl]
MPGDRCNQCGDPAADWVLQGNLQLLAILHHTSLEEHLTRSATRAGPACLHLQYSAALQHEQPSPPLLRRLPPAPRLQPTAHQYQASEAFSSQFSQVEAGSQATRPAGPALPRRARALLTGSRCPLPRVRRIRLLLFTPNGAPVLQAPRPPAASICGQASLHRTRAALQGPAHRQATIPPLTLLGCRHRDPLLPGTPQTPGTLFSRRRRPSISRAALD